MDDDALDHALAYAALGAPVFPLWWPEDGRCACGEDCASPAKHPHRLAPNGLDNATTDTEQIRRWWTTAPKANVGVRTGVAFDVLDIDSEDANARVLELARAEGDTSSLGAGPMVQTAHGWHLHYLPTGAGNRTDMDKLGGIDWRGARGYVVGAGSTHITGHVYAWHPDCGPDVPTPEAPSWLAAMARKEHRSAVPETPRRPLGGSVDAYGRRALESEVAKLAMAPDGTRNDALNEAAFSLGQLVAVGRLDAHDVVDALVAVARRIGLGEREIERTVQSGMTAGIAQPRRGAA